MTTSPYQDTVRPNAQRRSAERCTVAVPARLTWKDQRGATRFASAITRDMSEQGVYVETTSPVSISLYRLVHLQLERNVRDAHGVPASLRDGRILSAVYRVSPPAPGRRQGLALRLMVEPKRRGVDQGSQRATA